MEAVGWIHAMFDLSFIQKDIANMIGVGGISSPVIVRWTTVVGGAVDPVHGGVVGGVETPHQQTFQALIHSPSYAQAQARRHVVGDSADLIFDFSGDVDFTGLTGLTFEFEGRKYHPKKVDDTMAKAWDVHVGGKRLIRTVLVELVP